MFLCLSWDSTIKQNSVRTISDLNLSRLTDTRSAENDRIGADTDPEYRINASLVSPEIYDHFHCFEHVKLQVVKTAPDSQLLNLLSVSRLVTILNEADDCGVFCKLQKLDRGVFRCAVVRVHGEEQNTGLRSSSADGAGAG